MKLTDKIELTNEDNMLLMARYPDNYFDLAIVDPPYGSNDAFESKMTDSKKQASKRTKYKEFENVVPSQDYFKELKRVSKKQIIWGGNYFGLSGGVIVWDKKGTAFGDGEIAICSTHKSVRIFEYTWNGMLQGDMKNKEIRIHPTQKPVALYKWILDKYAKPNDKILDTHLGSMSIAIACADYGFELVGCELDPEYYDKGVKRVQNHLLQQKLF
jgi:site-specific DNA-methyltransferase (adenine-specific)